MSFPVDPTDRFLEPVIGHMGPQNPVADFDYVYLSAEGPAYRHYKDTVGVQFWDELIASLGPQGAQGDKYTDPTAPLGGTGAQYPTYSAPVGRPLTTIGAVSIAGPASRPLGGSGTYVASIAGDATNLEYTWTVTNMADVTVATPKAATTSITFGAQGHQGLQTIFCEVRDGTSKDSRRTGSKSVEIT